MGRKDLTEERTAEILEAFARSILKHGLDVSLEQVAQEAGMTRSIIRHYIGNREAVVNALIERIIDEYMTQLTAASAAIPHEYMISATLDYLFNPAASYDDYDKLIFNVMMTAKDRYPKAKQGLLTMMNGLVGRFATSLQRAYPAAGEGRCKAVAYSIIALSMSNETFLWLGMDADYNTSARAHAEALIATLGAET